jgi:hypothetical protein
MGNKINFEIIKKVIDKWDPIDLLDYAPPDEYDIESREILLKFQHSIEQNGMVIYEVFSKAFGMTFTKSVDECVSIAKKNNGTGITKTVMKSYFLLP